VKISEFKNAKAVRPELVSISVDDFEARCRAFVEKPLVRSPVEDEVKDRPGEAENIYRHAETKERGAAFAPVVLKAGTTRKAANVVEVHAFVADLDDVGDDVVDGILRTLESAGVRHWGWTTFGHGWKHPRGAWRIVVPFAAPVVVEDTPGLWLAVWSRIGEALFRGAVDGSTKDACRLHFYAGAPLIVGTLERGWWENDAPLWTSGGVEVLDPTAIVEDARASLAATVAANAARPKTSIAAEAMTEAEAVRQWGAATLARELGKLGAVPDKQKHDALLRTARLLGGYVPHALSEGEVFSSLVGVLGVWRAQGKRVGPQAKDEATIRDGINHGKGDPIWPKSRELDRYLYTLDDVDEEILARVNEWADRAAAGEDVNADDVEGEDVNDAEGEDEKKTPAGDDAGVRLRLVQGGPDTARTVEKVSPDIVADKLWARFAALPGIPGLFAREMEARVDYRQPGLMLGGGLALCSILGMRRFVFEGLTSGIVVCSVAGTSTGKGAPQDLVVAVLKQTWGAILGPDDFVSSASFLAGLEEAVKAQIGQAYVVDEYGPQLKVMLNDHNVAMGALRGALLKITSANTKTLSFAKPQGQGGGKREMIAPTIVLYGSTTPEALHDALSSLSTRDGYMGRHVWFTDLSVLPRFNRAVKRGPIDPALVAAVDKAREAHQAWISRVPSDGVSLYVPDEVTIDPAAAEFLLNFREACDERRRKQTDEMVEGSTGRTAEQAKRIALALAVASDTRGGIPRIDLTIIRLACDIAEHSATVIEKHLASQAGGADPWERKVAKVRRAVARLSDRGEALTRSNLMRSANLGADDVQDVLIFWKESGQEERYGTAGLLKVKTKAPAGARDGEG
jgi:hypothetical protein